MGQKSSKVSYNSSSYVDKSKITDFIVDTSEESFDLSDFTNLECIDYRLNKIPIITGVTNVKHVILNKMARNMNNIIKAKQYTIPANLFQNGIFTHAQSLEIKGDGNPLILDNFDGDKYPNLITLEIESVAVDSELLCDISKLKLLRRLIFKSCSGIKSCDWNIIEEHCPHLISLGFKSMEIDSQMLHKISSLKRLRSLEFDSCTRLRSCDWTKLDLPELQVLLTDIDRQSKLSNIKFLEKYRNLVVLRLNISSKCKNIDVLSKLTPRYLHLKKIIPGIILPTSVEMLNLRKVKGSEQSIKYMENLKMLCVHYIFDGKTSEHLEISDDVLQTHNRMDDKLCSVNKALWNKGFDDIIETIRAQQGNIKVIEPVEVTVADQVDLVVAPTVATVDPIATTVDPTAAYKELLEKVAVLTKYIESQKMLGK